MAYSSTVFLLGMELFIYLPTSFIFLLLLLEIISKTPTSEIISPNYFFISIAKSWYWHGGQKTLRTIYQHCSQNIFWQRLPARPQGACSVCKVHCQRAHMHSECFPRTLLDPSNLSWALPASPTGSFPPLSSSHPQGSHLPATAGLDVWLLVLVKGSSSFFHS